MSSHRILAFCAALQGFVAVLLGALGAHPLKEALLARSAFEAWQTATHYHLAHAVGSLALLAWAASFNSAARAVRLVRAAWLWQLGCLLFAGSIYGLALGGPRFLGPITPLGGLAFLTGWAMLAAESLRRTSAPSAPPSA